ncbi:chromosome partition protein Smc-like [Hydra vulgaris]|uniref:Chromosome partition protein Smc-like n=1 Tax=Hydra vulgaris TaxID=6087 RepID=A0ABM4C8F9_HYDVU
MSNNSEWSKEFHNVIKDTDKNIASIKQQLQVKKAKEINLSHNHKGSNILSSLSLLSDGQFEGTSDFTSLSSLKKDLKNIHPNFKSSYLTSKDKLIKESSSALVKTLFLKVEDLSQAVVCLKKVVESQEKQIQELKESQKFIENKINIENIADDMKKDFQSQIDSICSVISKQQKLRHMSSSEDNSKTDKLLITSLEDDINTMKRDAFEMKQKIKILERDIQTNSRNITGEISCIEKDVKSIAQNQNILHRSTIKKEQSLEDIRHELFKVSEDLNDLKEHTRSKTHLANVPKFSSSVKNDYRNYTQRSLTSSQKHDKKKHNQSKAKLDVSSPVVTTVLSLNDLDQSLEESSIDLLNSRQHNKSIKSDFWGTLEQSDVEDLKTLKNSFGSDIDYSLDDFDEITDDLLEDELLTYDT